MSLKRLFVDLKENCNGEITGTVKVPKDSLFALEALIEVLRVLSSSCGVPPEEIAQDMTQILRRTP